MTNDAKAAGTVGRHFTDGQDCFALRDLPEEVKGALFARYSRTAKPLRELWADEFAADADARAGSLYERVLDQYGDDSVAQLGSAHIACEGVSNVLTKILERGRLMSYLEQSTRYIPYDRRDAEDRWLYAVPAEVSAAGEGRRNEYEGVLDRAFETYADLMGPMRSHHAKLRPRGIEEDPKAYERALRGRTLDTLRGLLPAATRSNLGIHGSGQAFERLLLRLLSHELDEARTTGRRMLRALQEVVPAFVRRVDRPDRGGEWCSYLGTLKGRAREATDQIGNGESDPQGAIGEADVRLLEASPQGDAEVLAGLLYEAASIPHAQLRQACGIVPARQRRLLLRRLVGERSNRRHRPGRGFEAATYVFEITGDYGIFRDLQRHRILTMQWQNLTTAHGYVRPAILQDDHVGAHPELRTARSRYDEVMERAAQLHELLAAEVGPVVAQYAVPMAYRIRFLMRLNAREAMHMLELRTQPAGHPSYRRVCQRMHEAIGATEGHEGIAEAMRFVDHGDAEQLGRIGAEQRQAARERSRSVRPTGG